MQAYTQKRWIRLKMSGTSRLLWACYLDEPRAVPSLVRRLSASMLSLKSFAISTNSPFWILVTNFAGIGGKLSPIINGAASFAPPPAADTVAVFSHVSPDVGGGSSPNTGRPRSATSRVGGSPLSSATRRMCQ